MTWMPRRARGALVALVGATLLLAATATPAAADEEETTPQVVTETQVFVTSEDGDRKVKVFRLKDGAWVPVDREKGAAGMRVLGGAGHAEEAEKAAGAPAADSPLPTIVRWFFEDAAKEKDPLDAWFEAGDDVPFARLRDALKRDGWTPDRLRAWMYEMVSSHLEAFLAHHGRAGHGHGAAQGPWWGLGHATRPQVHPGAWVLWWDGTQWQRQPIPTPPVMHHAPRLAPRMPVPHHAMPPSMPVPHHSMPPRMPQRTPVRPQAMPPMPPAPPPPPVPPMQPVPPVGPGFESLPPEAAALLKQLLGAEGSSPATADLVGIFSAFAELDPATREALIKQLAEIGVQIFGADAPEPAEKAGAR